MISKLSIFFFAAVSAFAAEPALMPWPASIQMGGGSAKLTGSFYVRIEGHREARLDAAAQRLMSRFAEKTQMPRGFGLEGERLVVHCAGPSRPVQTVGEDESYTLSVAANGTARLDAANSLGVLRGFETYLQLVNGKEMPVVRIRDAPRFPWRGLLIDVSRHFMPVDTIKRNLDVMAAVKMNVFHWHLSDDQGFRVESKVFPKLHQIGSEGQFYTQEQVRGVIAYARDRGIRVVPEFDVPGHTASWLVGYPELATDTNGLRIEHAFGVHDAAMDPSKEAVYTFLDKFIGEMAALFPDEYFHIGGDEVNGKQWSASASVQAFLKSHSMPSGKAGNEAIQAYFNERVLGLLKKYGKKMEGWDEILNPALPKDIVIQSWRGQKSLADAAKQGFTGILSTGYYLDHMDTAAKHYAVDPLGKDAAGLDPQQRGRILGGESCMWGEYVSPENIDGRIWPRNAVIAERLWSAADVTDAASMYWRLDNVSRDLELAGSLHRKNYEKMLARLAGPGRVGPVRELADVCEAGSLGVRHRAHDYLTSEPFNRLPDTVLPESDSARRFGELAARVKADPAAAAEVRQWLLRWRENPAKLRPVIAGSPLLASAEPVSVMLADLARIGLEAMDAIEHGKRLDQAWAAKAKKTLTAASRPVAEVRIAVVPGIQMLTAMAVK